MNDEEKKSKNETSSEKVVKLNIQLDLLDLIKIIEEEEKKSKNFKND